MKVLANLPVSRAIPKVLGMWFFSLSGLLMLSTGSSSWAATSGKSTSTSHTPATLDTAAVHSEYNDGDFDKVLASLEPFITQNLAISHADSLFLFKHLGVIYSKDAASREKGKYCFRKLFDLDPNAQILDMYATDDIYAIFRTVHDEWLLSHPQAAKPMVATATDNSTATTTSSSQPATSKQSAMRSKSHSDDWKIWAVAGSAVVVTAGAATWFLLSQPADDTKTTLVIDPNGSETP